MRRPALILSAVLMAVVSAPTSGALAWSWIVRDVQLRSHPDPDARPRALLFACERVDVIGERRGWLRVDSDAGLGWLPARLLSDWRPAHCGRYRPRPEPHRPRPPAFFDTPPHPEPVPPRPRHVPSLDDWNRRHDW
jgi:hypothetical protein